MQPLKTLSLALVTLFLYLPTTLQATPTLVDSIAATQLQGVKVKSISSLHADNGTLWITDSSNQVFQWELGEIPTAVVSGSEKQKFSSVLPINNNRTIVTDASNHQFLIGTGNKWQAFAQEGELEGQLDKPVAVAWSNEGIIYIADAGNKRISAFTDTGLFLFTFGDNAIGEDEDDNLTGIQSIAVDQLGRVYVLDNFKGGRISIYSALGALDVILGKDEFSLLTPDARRITAMTVRPDGVLLIADKNSGRIHEIDWENMTILSSFATIGKGRGQLQRVGNLSLDDDGKLYIADNGNGKIEVFQLDWEKSPWLNIQADKLSIRPSSVLKSACDVSYIYTEDTMLCLQTKDKTVTIRSHDGTISKTLNASFKAPIRATFDKREILILDRDSVHVFDHTGIYKFTFGSKGRRDGELSQASSITLSPTSVYIADTGNARIQLFSRNGLFKKTIGNAKRSKVTLEEPVAIAVDKRGSIYVADAEFNQVFIYNHQGKLTHRLGEKEDHPRAFTHLYDVAVGADNILFVLASMHNNPTSVWMYQNDTFIYRFSPTQESAKAGIDQRWRTPLTNKAQDIQSLKAEATQAASNISELTIDPEDALFKAKESMFGNDEQWMFDKVPNNPDTFAIVEVEGHARHTFNLLRAPKNIAHITISGDEDTLTLAWEKPTPSFSGYYRIYSRANISEPFVAENEVLNTNLTTARNLIKSTEYRISAISPMGKESQISAVFQDDYWLGYQQFKAQEFKQARSFFKRVIQNNPNQASAWLYLGKTQVQLGKLKHAVNTFKHLTTFSAYKQRGLHLQAETLGYQQAWLDIKSLVDNSEAEGAVDAILYSLAAHALIQMDDIPSAIYYLGQAVALEPTSALWHLKLADANFELGAKDSAEIELIKASQLANQDIQAWLEVARTYHKHQFFNQAISSYDSALLVAPQNTQALSELAVLHLEQGNLEQAKGLATKMANISELKGTSYYILGRVALAEDKAPQALAMLAKAGQTDPSNANVWVAMADAYAKINNAAREQQYLQKAIALDDSIFNVHIRLGKACDTKNDVPCMLAHYEKAAMLQEKNMDAKLGYAQALMKSGKMNEAAITVQQALALEPNSIPAHIIRADIQNARGMIRDSIVTLKKAMLIDDTNMGVHLSLTKAYIGNHMYDEAIAITEKASLLDVLNPAPLILTASIYLARQSFDQAISSLEKAVDLAPNNAKYRQQLNLAYLQKKRAVGADGNMLGPKLKHVSFTRVFSAAYKQYIDVPVGKIILKNEAGIDYTNVKISLLVKEYMDFPTTLVVERIAAGAEIEIPLLAAFNNRILDIDEDTGVQTEVRAEYYLAGKPHVETLNTPLTIYGKNAIVWDQLDMVGSFATPKDDTLAVFTRQLVNAYAPKKGAVNAQVAKAMTVFNGFSAYGIKYLLDPNTPYDQLGADQLDTIQFPRETLRQRSGDCDDLSILLAAALANLGIETAILDVPQHLLMMFNTGLSEEQQDLISSNSEALAIIDGQVWVPIEATLIAASFTEAWAEGARKYHLYGKQATMKIMPLAQAWKTYPPVTLPPADFVIDIPSREVLGVKIEKEWEILSVKALERQVRPYRLMLALDPSNIQAKMQIAIVYAQSGLYDQAIHELQAMLAADAKNLAVINNIGNIYYLQQKYAAAISMYKNALNIETNADIMVNIAMAHYKLGDVLRAKSMFAQATESDEQIATRYHALALLLKQ